MTASPTPTAAVPGDVGLPSEEGAIAAYNAVWQAAPAVDAHNVNIVRREAMAAVYALIRPAFEAKEREIERYEAMIKAEQDAAIHWCGEAAKLNDRALSAETKLAQAVEDEREACAKIAEDYPAHEHGHLDADPHYAARQAAHEVAGAIRARSASRGATE